MQVLALALVLVHGVVMRGPTMPVCKVGTPCSAPAAHVVLTFTHRGRVVRAATDAHGRYRVRLRPGRYVVRLAPTPKIGRGISPSVLVVRAAMRADFDVDTGIR